MHFKASYIALIVTAQVGQCAYIPATQHALGVDFPASTPSDNSPFDKVKNALKEASIIGDVVDDFIPKCFVAPSYGKDNPVHLGNHMDPHDTKKKPTMKVLCPGMNFTSGMTMVLTDPDAPSREDPKWGEFCHWIAGVKSVRPEEFEVQFSDMVKYKAPAPPRGTGPHRYVFLLLEGVNTNLTKPEGRKRWGHKNGFGVQGWAEDEGLVVVGGNFFYAKHESN